MATANHVLLRRITLNASASSVTFDSIPQTGYTDLKISISARTSHSAPSNNILIQPNGLTTNLSSRRLAGTGSTAASYNSATLLYAFEADGDGATSNTFSNGDIYIPNYRGSTFKSFSSDGVMETNAATAYMTMSAGLWSSNSAITSLTFIPESGYSFLANSTFSLYGIADVNTIPTVAPKADGGDIIKTDGTYWYHAFLTSGTFKPQLNLTADILQVAGGGGSGSAGGGAGGLLGFTGQALLSGTTYSATVGAGGAAATQGGSSQFASLTASVGGGAGGNPPGNGGSGGGSAGYTVGSPYGRLAGGTATSGQGYAGGSGYWGGPYNGGGGGGAGGVGGDSSSNNPGTGGAGGTGSSAYSSWGSATGTGQNVSGTYYYAGGGGGAANLAGSNGYTLGVGGNGGGGNGNASDGAGVAGTAGTGGGGGGSDGVAGVAGGSGIIIIRYAV